MKGYIFTDHHEIGSVEKGAEKVMSFPTAAEALRAPSGNELWFVAMKGLRSRSPYTGKMEASRVKFLKCFGDKSEEVARLSEMISTDVQSLWEGFQTPEEAIQNSDEKRYSTNGKTAREANKIFHAAIVAQSAMRSCSTIKDLATIVSHAISAWEAVCLNKRDEAIERYSRWIKEVSR
jgi:hypothetical protein